MSGKLFKYSLQSAMFPSVKKLDAVRSQKSPPLSLSFTLRTPHNVNAQRSFEALKEDSVYL